MPLRALITQWTRIIAHIAPMSCGLSAMGCEIGHTSTPIIPLFIRDDFKTFQVTHDLLDEGVFVNPVVTPAVAPHDTLIRYSLMATHTKEQVTHSLEAIEKVFRRYGIIK